MISQNRGLMANGEFSMVVLSVAASVFMFSIGNEIPGGLTSKGVQEAAELSAFIRSIDRSTIDELFFSVFCQAQAPLYELRGL